MRFHSLHPQVASPDASQYDTAVSQMLRHDDDHDNDDDDPADDRTEAPPDADDDDTQTLRSCFDMPFDPAQTHIGSDLSSADSTPVRKVRSVRRALTLKQKRQATKERYRTYTIAADMMLLDSADEAATGDGATEAENDDDDDDEDAVTWTCVEEKLNGADVDGASADKPNTVQIEIVEGKTRLTPRQRRHEDRDRFQTQVNLIE